MDTAWWWRHQLFEAVRFSKGEEFSEAQINVGDQGLQVSEIREKRGGSGLLASKCPYKMTDKC